MHLNRSHPKPCIKLIYPYDTLENSCEVRVVSGVPELHVLVRPPGDTRSRQRDLYLCAIWVVIKQLQRVCNEHKKMIKTFDHCFYSVLNPLQTWKHGDTKGIHTLGYMCAVPRGRKQTHHWTCCWRWLHTVRLACFHEKHMAHTPCWVSVNDEENKKKKEDIDWRHHMSVALEHNLTQVLIAYIWRETLKVLKSETWACRKFSFLQMRWEKVKTFLLLFTYLVSVFKTKRRLAAHTQSFIQPRDYWNWHVTVVCCANKDQINAAQVKTVDAFGNEIWHIKFTVDPLSHWPSRILLKRHLDIKMIDCLFKELSVFYFPDKELINENRCTNILPG